MNAWVNCVGRRRILVEETGPQTILHIYLVDKRLASLVLEPKERDKLAEQLFAAVKVVAKSKAKAPKKAQKGWGRRA